MKCIAAPLILTSVLISGCASVAVRTPVSETVPGMDFLAAKRRAISLLKAANIETTAFKYATMGFAFKYRVNEDAIVFSYMKYANILDSAGSPKETSCGYEYLDAGRVDEYTSSMNPIFKYEVPLGQACDNLSVYFGNRENAIAFATTMLTLKKLAAEGLTTRTTTRWSSASRSTQSCLTRSMPNATPRRSRST